jgi:hypothetical protein
MYNYIVYLYLFMLIFWGIFEKVIQGTNQK